jgi:hypothetical protein
MHKTLILGSCDRRYISFGKRYYLQNVEVFAGFNGKKPLEDKTIDRLKNKYGGEESKWQHAKGFGIVDYYGEEVDAQVHWFQEKSVGRVDFFVKEWYF